MAALTLLWFGSFQFDAFMGDDLDRIVGTQTGGYASSLTSALTELMQKKYRPVAGVLLYLESRAFGQDFSLYTHFNMVLHLVNACLVGFIAWRLSRRSYFVAFAAGASVLVSRFSYYNVLLSQGAWEALPLLLFLLTLDSVLRAYEQRRARPLFWALLWFFLLQFTRERYVVVVGFFTLAIWLAPVAFRQRWYRLVLSAVPMAILAGNYLAKVAVLHTNFFEGTGGQSIAFDYGQFALFLIEGAANLVGFNVGSNYLSGLSVLQAGFLGFAVGTALFASMAAIVLIYLRRQLAPDRRSSLATSARDVLLFCALLGPLLAGASVAIRLEQRWLHAPYVVLILGIAYFSGRLFINNRLRLVLVAAVLVSAFGVEAFYRPYLHNVYFVDGLMVASSAKARIVVPYRTELARDDVYIVTQGRPEVRSWYFFDNAFFQFYTGDPQVKVNYVDSLDSLVLDPGRLDHTLVFALDEDRQEIVDLTLEVKATATTPIRGLWASDHLSGDW